MNHIEVKQRNEKILEDVKKGIVDRKKLTKKVPTVWQLFEGYC